MEFFVVVVLKIMTQTTDDGRFGPAWRMKQDYYKFSEFSNFDHFHNHGEGAQEELEADDEQEGTIGELAGVDEHEGALTEAEGLGAGFSNTSL